jgi:cellulose synthase/poly-beta-1,6-N-acetylglucosamine synthase-like glycosyltransferase
MRVLFWLSFALIVYVYFGYPVLLAAIRSVRARPVKKKYWEPDVSIVIAAHDEGERIQRRLDNCLGLDYPKHRLQVIVSLDGPTAATESIARKYAARGVETVCSSGHRGKAVALNRALGQARGQIVVFADARQIFSPTAIRELVANFADEKVGAVSGELVLLDKSEREAASDVGLYWRYEKALRVMESEIHSMAGATGAIYAIRRELFEDLPDDTILDDVLTPLRIVLKGRRTVFEARAKAYDTVACCAFAEYGRKVRTLCGNYQLIRQLPQLLVPWRNPIFIQFVSHKLGRLVVPWALLAMFVSNLSMLQSIYLLTFCIQVAWYAVAALGWIGARNELAVISPYESEEAA